MLFRSKVPVADSDVSVLRYLQPPLSPIASDVLMRYGQIKHFARAGSQLVLADRNPKGLEQTVAECNLDRSKTLIRVVDITDVDAAEELVSSIPRELGRLDFAL